MVAGTIEAVTPTNRQAMKGNNHDALGEIRSHYAGGSSVQDNMDQDNAAIQWMLSCSHGLQINPMVRKRFSSWGDGVSGNGHGNHAA